MHCCVGFREDIRVRLPLIFGSEEQENAKLYHLWDGNRDAEICTASEFPSFTIGFLYEIHK